MDVGRVVELWRFPVKSFQGERLERLELGDRGVVGDREWALIDRRSGKLMSAKRHGVLFEARAATEGGEVVITLPDATQVAAADPVASERLSAWLGWDVELRHVDDHVAVAYEMTFDPPNDDAEYVDVPAPPGSFLDLADVHLLTTATLAGGRAAAPDLDWDVRRFRPNVVVELAGGADPAAAFTEDGWAGQDVALGAAAVAVQMPTVRCAMPLRGQPGLARQPRLYAALEALHANHLGVYCAVATPGLVGVGDPVALAG